MNTDLTGRVANTSLPQSNALLPLFEAVVNSIHAIEEIDECNGKIEIRILREKTQPELSLGEKRSGVNGDIIGFAISDNGVGFNKVNYDAFGTLDTPHKREKGGKGMGRLLWLKAFENVEIESSYVENGVAFTRRFDFRLPKGVYGEEPIEHIDISSFETNTTVTLKGFTSFYRKKAHKTSDAIARDVLNHCMWYFIKEGGAPDIVLVDEDRVINLHDLKEQYLGKQAQVDSFYVKDIKFNVIHIRLRGSFAENASISYCANNRVVKIENFSAKNDWIKGGLADSEGEFSYQCYVTSEYLDRCVSANRLDFEFEADHGELFQNNAPSREEIEKSLISNIKEHLKAEIELIKERSKIRVRHFVERIAPRYRPIVDNSPDIDIINPNISDKDLELILHEKKCVMERQLLVQGQKLINASEAMQDADYTNQLNNYLNDLNAVKSSDLASYVFHRRIVIDILSNIIRKDRAGKYPKEEVIHQLIFPMRETSDSIELMDTNLWLIDERLVFHHFLASDKTISSMPITRSNSRREPDICSLRVNESSSEPLESKFVDNPIVVSNSSFNGAPASLTVVEFKRPMRDDASDKDNPIGQILDYFIKIRDGKVTTIDGRDIPNSSSIPYFGYIICDLTPSLKKICLKHDYKKSADGMGYYYYNDNLNAYIEIISYDKLLISARERNQAFFDKLGLPSC